MKDLESGSEGARLTVGRLRLIVDGSKEVLLDGSGRGELIDNAHSQ